MKARLIDISSPTHHQTMAEILLKGGIIGTIWGHHLYFLACNASNQKAVDNLNKLKFRAKGQVFASPGAVEEAEEFADVARSKGLNFAARKMRMKPLRYLEFLYRKFPLGIELFAKPSAPNTVTFATKDGKTIWIAGHMKDKYYSKLLQTVREMRRNGQNVVFAGTSLNLKGDNTLTVKELDAVVESFASKIDAISVHPQAKNLKRLNFTTSCSVVSFVGSKPKLLRAGCTKVETLKKYIPDLEISTEVTSTRKPKMS